MKKKILIVAAAALVTLGIATVSAQSPVRVQMSENFVFSVVEAPRYGAAGATVDANGNVTLDVELHLIGDINGDGEVKLADYVKTLRHVKELETLSGYEFSCADVTGDGFVKLADYVKILRHVKGAEYLWNN